MTYSTIFSVVQRHSLGWVVLQLSYDSPHTGEYITPGHGHHAHGQGLLCAGGGGGVWDLPHHLHGGVQDEDGGGDDAYEDDTVSECDKVVFDNEIFKYQSSSAEDTPSAPGTPH